MFPVLACHQTLEWVTQQHRHGDGNAVVVYRNSDDAVNMPQSGGPISIPAQSWGKLISILAADAGPGNHTPHSTLAPGEMWHLCS